MVSGLVCVDIVILVIWQLTDPLQRVMETFPLENPITTTDDIKIRPELEHCESTNNSMWLGNSNKICNKFTIIGTMNKLQASFTALKDLF